MEGMNPDGYRPKMGRTKASQKQIVHLQNQILELSKRVAELEKKKATPKAKKKSEEDSQE